MSREKNIYITIVFNLFLQVVSFSYKFLITPFLLNVWGSLKYGEWLVLFSFVSSISLLNFGIAKFYGNNLRKAFIEKNFIYYKENIFEALAIGIVIFILSVALILFLLTTSNLNELLNIHNWSENEINLTIFFLSMSIIGMIFLEIVLYLFVSIGKYSYKPMIEAFNLLLQIILIMILSTQNVGMVAISAVIFFSVLIVTLISAVKFFLTHPDLIPTKLSFNINNFKNNIFNSSYFQLITFSQFLILQGSILIISNQIGAASVTLFVIMRTITSSLGRQLTHIINHGIWPELTTLFAEMNYPKVVILHHMLTQVSYLLISIFSIFILLFIDNIFNIWLSTQEYLDYDITLLFLIYLTILHTWIPSSFLLMANNHVKGLGILTFLGSIFFIILCFLFSNNYGLEGVLWAMIISDLIILTTAVPRLASNDSHESIQMFYIQMIKALVPLGLIFLIFYLYGMSYIVNSGIIIKLAFFVIASLLVGLYYWFFSFSQYEKQYIYKKIKPRK